MALYQHSACLWDAAHEDHTKNDKNEEEIGDYKKQMENSAISIFAYK